jgi:hypothetical protein
MRPVATAFSRIASVAGRICFNRLSPGVGSGAAARRAGQKNSFFEGMRMQEQTKSDEVGPYRLVALPYEGEHYGVVYVAGAKVVTVRGTSVDECFDQILAWTTERLAETARARNGKPPEASELACAFLRIAPRMHDGQRAMLKAHLKAEGRRITAPELAAAADYKGHEAANLHYGRLGWLLYGEVPSDLPGDLRTGAPVYTFALATGSPEPAGWVWTLRPEVAEAALTAGLG